MAPELVHTDADGADDTGPRDYHPPVHAGAGSCSFLSYEIDDVFDGDKFRHLFRRHGALKLILQRDEKRHLL